MTQKYFSVAAALLLVVGATITYFAWCSPVQAFCNKQISETSLVTSIKEIAPRYFEYSELSYAEAQKTGKKVVLYFWAPWCSTCAALDNEIAKDPQLIPDDVIILRIPYDSSTELKRKYSIVTQHTFVQVDAQGTPLQVWVGGEPSDFRKKL